MRRTFLTLAVAAMVIVSLGCAITDYDGWASHKTTAEAKLWGKEVAFTGFSSDLDGTYSYTVKYNTTPGVGSGKVTIYSYVNPGLVSFSRDGIIDRDGDDVQGGAGDAGGKFRNQFVAVDSASGSCEFFNNITQDKSTLGPQVALCIGGAVEEIDADFELGEAFSSLDSLLGKIWSGALTGDFTLNLTSIRLNGVKHSLSGVEIGASAAANRPARFTISNGPGVQDLIGVILNHTEHLEPVTIGLGFEGGLSVSAPRGMSVAFNHDGLLGL